MGRASGSGSGSGSGSSDDKLIVWPPCVLVENAGLGYDAETKKQIGLDAGEVRSAVNALARITIRRVYPVYGWNGHKGRYLVVFPDSAAGYTDAVALSEAFANRKRGRDDWRRACNDRSRKEEDEKKKELYGYLVEPDEIKRLDGNKSLLKNWKIESLQDKVIKFLEQKITETTENQKIAAELEACLNEQRKRNEKEKEEMEAIKMGVSDLGEEYAAECKRHEEAERKHAEQKAQMAKRFEEEKAARMACWNEKSKSILDEIHKNMKDDEDELLNIRQTNSSLENDIRAQQALAMADMRVQTHVRIATEAHKQLEEMKTRNEMKLKAMKERHLEERRKLLEERAAKKQAAWKDYSNNQEKLDKEMENQIGNECQICMEEFGPKKPKGFYAACKHARSCYDCTIQLWKASRECPHCRTVQKEMPMKLFE